MLEDRKAVVAASATLAAGALAVWALQPWWRRPRRRPEAAAAATSFESYLKRRVDNPALASPALCATSFEAYLRAPLAAAPTAAAPARLPAPAAVPGVAPRDARPVTVLYGTEFGFSKEVAQKACEALAAAGDDLWPQLIDMADHPDGLPLDRCQALLLVCSTQGDGVAPAEARPFCDWLASSHAPALAALPFTVAALGDTGYTHFARCGRRLDARLEELGARRLAPRVDVNREDWGAINTWIADAVAAVQKLPLRTARELGWSEPEAAATEGGAVAKRWGKARPYYGTVVAAEGLCTLRSKDDKNTVRVEIDLGDSGLSYEPGDALGIWPCNAPAAVEELLAAVGLDGGQPVPVPGGHYHDEAVRDQAAMPLREALERAYDLRQPRRELLQLLLSRRHAVNDHANGHGNGHASGRANGNANGHAAKTEEGQPKATSNGHANGHANGHSKGRANGHANGDGHAANLEQDAASNGHGKAIFVVANGNGNGYTNGNSAGGGHANGNGHAVHAGDDATTRDLQLLPELSALAYDAAAAERYLAPRHVIDVLRDWGAPRLTPALTAAELLGALRPLAPRLYSISSSPLQAPARVQVTVAVVRYLSLGKDRLGVCSTQLGERLKIGQQLPVYVARNPDFRLPSDPGTPLVMVGPGTGLAPFMAFLHHRMLGARAGGCGAPGRAALFFGCRRRDQDYLYRAQLEAWADAGAIDLFTAFSRERAGKKVYVQNRLREQAGLVWELLQAGGHFYVCGDAASMAGEVEQALLEIFAQRAPSAGGGGAASSSSSSGQEDAGDDEAAAERWARGYLAELAAAGRYQRDVWF